jgi:hypothetical protein
MDTLLSFYVSKVSFEKVLLKLSVRPHKLQLVCSLEPQVSATNIPCPITVDMPAYLHFSCQNHHLAMYHFGNDFHQI